MYEPVCSTRTTLSLCISLLTQNISLQFTRQNLQYTTSAN